jgi:NAD(P)H-dependent FMN reductase
MQISAEYLVISGSLRAVSRSRVLAQSLLDYYSGHQESARLLDLRTISLPFCDGEEAYVDPAVVQWAEIIAAARVIMVATPIYNFDVNAAVKNLVELTGDSWEDKVVGFLCAAGGQSSYMSVMGFANSLMLDFRCLIIPRFVYVTGEDFSDDFTLSEQAQARIWQLGEVSLSIKKGSQS